MKKQIINLAIITVATLVFFACSKKSSSSSASASAANLEGTWQEHEYIIDSLATGKINSYDLTRLADTENIITTFNSNGSYLSAKDSVTTGKGTWSLVDNNVYLVVTDTIGGGNTSTSFLIIISGSTATLYDTAHTNGNTAFWLI